MPNHRSRGSCIRRRTIGTTNKDLVAVKAAGFEIAVLRHRERERASVTRESARSAEGDEMAKTPRLAAAALLFNDPRCSLRAVHTPLHEAAQVAARAVRGETTAAANAGIGVKDDLLSGFD